MYRGGVDIDEEREREVTRTNRYTPPWRPDQRGDADVSNLSELIARLVPLSLVCFLSEGSRGMPPSFAIRPPHTQWREEGDEEEEEEEKNDAISFVSWLFIYTTVDIGKGTVIGMGSSSGRIVLIDHIKSSKMHFASSLLYAPLLPWSIGS